ncbi:hypothetical protein ACNVED_12420 [Legionella sp. D16C41]|uniref:hypothetical protein n=1 Tax=Legionella sp. D16C41 TaxID=3402688 RepID=UPI003AF62C20
MKFSERQAAYNKDWDTHVVPSYEFITKQLKNGGLNFFNQNNISAISIALKHYSSWALKILNDLNKNILAIEDHNLAKDYFTDTIAQIKQDFVEFSQYNLDNKSQEVIAAVNERIEMLQNDFSYKLENRQIYSFNQADNYEPFKESVEDVSGTLFEHVKYN